MASVANKSQGSRGTQRFRVVLGNAEIETLKSKKSLTIRLQSPFGFTELEIVPSALLVWNKYTEGSVESILDAMQNRRT